MSAAIYVRQSVDRHGRAEAVDRQLDACRELCESHGWTVGEVYSDNDTSATSLKLRPEWTRLLRDLRTGRHDVLVCWHTDRLYRRLRDLVELVELAEARSLRICTVKAADLDLGTPSGRMLAGMLGSAARYEVEQKGARQVAANRARAQRGVVLWTRRPFGFERNGANVFVVEAEAAVVRDAAQRVLDGATLASIARDLNAADVPTSTGTTWSVTTLRRVLLNPRIAGRVVYRGTDMGDEHVAPAILDSETFSRVLAKLTDPRRRTAASTAAKYLLSGLVMCGRCDTRMYATPVVNRGRRWMTYKCFTCRLARKLNDVDGLVTQVVLARLSRPDAARLLAPQVDVADLYARATDLRDRRDVLAVLLADGLQSEAAVREQSARLTSEIADLDRQIEAATGASPLTSIVGADDVAARWEGLGLTIRRAIVVALLTATVLPVGKGRKFEPEHVAIEWKS